MKKLLSSVIGGIAGAVALNILHQEVKQFDNEAPRVDLVGEEALSKGLERIGGSAANWQYFVCNYNGRRSD
jgi:hypothetical protein